MDNSSANRGHATAKDSSARFYCRPKRSRDIIPCRIGSEPECFKTLKADHRSNNDTEIVNVLSAEEQEQENDKGD
jgi:hypothetical protein